MLELMREFSSSRPSRTVKVKESPRPTVVAPDRQFECWQRRNCQLEALDSQAEHPPGPQARRLRTSRTQANTGTDARLHQPSVRANLTGGYSREHRSVVEWERCK